MLFQSTHSLRSATGRSRFACTRLKVSIHALLAECDIHQIPLRRPPALFQSTHSLRSATPEEAANAVDLPVSIHALLAECDYPADELATSIYTVSIHALLAECDQRPCPGQPVRPGFNPRTPCGVRPGTETGLSCADRFQSTHSLRSATEQVKVRTPGGQVSIHALLAECDIKIDGGFTSVNQFQSTHSLRSATGRWPHRHNRPHRFNPRTPCGVRRHGTFEEQRENPVSIHALLAECDPRDF